ncbi:hypothetical protein [Luteibacter sp. Lutesp34]|uniref:hypothetical protein n=1 Tax=Luteibacter sp. Lutesp34 TaxID=3243030 RepID=UPI0039B59575
MKPRFAHTAAVTALLVFGGAQPAMAAPTVNTYAGTTAVSLSSALLDALSSLNVSVSRQFPADLNGGTARFPIPTGQIDLGSAHGEIVHAGGLNLKAGATTVTLSDFVIDTTGPTPVLTGLVAANGDVVGRLPLFAITLTRNPVIRNFGVAGQVSISGASLALTDAAAQALNGAFGVTAFAQGIPVGTASVNAFTLNPAYIH